MNAETVCFILKGYPRISETFISKEILALEQLGFTISIVSMRRPREPFSHAHIKRIKARVDYLPDAIAPHLRVLLHHNLSLAFKRPGRYGRALGKALVRWSRSRKIATFKHLFQAGYLVHKLLPQIRICHFHAHFAHSPASVALFASLLSGLPFSFFAHAKDIYTQNRRQLREKIRMAQFTVTCTRYNQTHLTRLAGNAAPPVRLVRHGIDLDFFVPPPDRPAPAAPYRILTVARHTPKKGLDLVIRAMAILRDKGIAFSHTIIGDGELREELTALIRSLDLSRRVYLAGTLPHEEVIGYYARADLFVLGCRISPDGDRDGIPNVLAEAMAMGVPVAAPHVSGLSELLVHGKTGLLVPVENPEAIAFAVQKLLLDHRLRERVIPAARTHLEKIFDHKQQMVTLAQVYREGMNLPPDSGLHRGKKHG